MTALLNTHLEQISLCAQSISSLTFPGPKIFTNALLNSHDITSLIRDTEAHERALFHLAPPPLPTTNSNADPGGSSGAGSAAPTGAQRRATVYGGRHVQPKNKAVAAVLGGDLYARTRPTDVESSGRQKGSLDVEVLLQGAEKLAAVYPIPGAKERISTLRRRHAQLEANIEHYESRVSTQGKELEKMNRGGGDANLGEEDEDEGEQGHGAGVLSSGSTREDLEREEQEVKELERKKTALEERVTGMERDLGGLMR